MPKWAKTIVAIALLPVCLGAAATLWKMARNGGQAENFWIAFITGAAAWAVVFAMLPKPMWIYVFGHELTHAVWAWAFGGQVKRFKVSSKGGHVVLNKTNFVIALAPYFFPVYAALVAIVFAVGHLIWDWSHYVIVFHLLLGAAYSFHVTLTVHILKTSQSDITSQGYLFSGVVIFLGNAATLILGLSPLLGERLLTTLGWWFSATGGVLRNLDRLI